MIMFGLPDAKRVKRSRLFSTSSRSSSEDDEGIIASAAQHPRKDPSLSQPGRTKQSKIPKATGQTETLDGGEDVIVDYGFEYDFIEPLRQGSSERDSKSHDKDENTASNKQGETHQEQSYEFLLFRPTKSNATATNTIQPQTAVNPTKITIRSSPTPEKDSSESHNKGSILHPRPQSHYFTSQLPSSVLHQLRSEYISVAISGSQIESQLSRTVWRGTNLPWRVIHIKTSSSSSSSPAAAAAVINPIQSEGGKRKKPSKKRRILLRQRIRHREKLLESNKVSEEAEREKRTRRNREKKVKRKEREKRKKEEKDKGSDKKEAGDEVDVGVGTEMDTTVSTSD